jgi:hypothetical protein
VLDQKTGQQVANVALIIDDKDMGRVVHKISLSR